MIIKNSNLRRFLYGIRYKILAIIVAIILALSIIRALNEEIKQNESYSNKSTTQTINKSQHTVIMGGDISSDIQERNEEIIDTFFYYCNAKEIEKAYELLTDECREVMFSSNIENFKKDYVEKIFSTSKIHNIQSWINGEKITYKVRILEDAMATGKTGDAIENYFTIVRKNNDYKLNINDYIGREYFNKESTVKDIKIKVLNKDIYMDYEIYNLQVVNNTENSIMLDSKLKDKSIYLTGRNGTTYRAFTYEIKDDMLTVRKQREKNISIRFNKVYNLNTSVSAITFTDIIQNLAEYEKVQNKEEYKDRLNIAIEL